LLRYGDGLVVVVVVLPVVVQFRASGRQRVLVCWSGDACMGNCMHAWFCSGDQEEEDGKMAVGWTIFYADVRVCIVCTRARLLQIIKGINYWVSPSADVPTTVYVLARKKCIESEVGYDFAGTYNLLR
jgi:hypothetical protein